MPTVAVAQSADSEAAEPVETDPAADPAADPEPATDPAAEPEPATGSDSKKSYADRVVWGALIPIRVNPLGLKLRSWVGWRHRLNDDPDIIWQDNHFGVSLRTELSPASARAMATVTVQPLAILTLRAGVGPYMLFGTMGHMASFPGASSADNPDAISAREDADSGRFSVGLLASLSASFQIRLGPIGFKNEVAMHHYRMQLPDGDIAFYDPTLDTLIPNNGWVLDNSTTLVAFTDVGLFFGVRSTITQPIADWGADRLSATLGPVIGYKIFDEPGCAAGKSAVLLTSEWYLKHPYRSGVTVSAAIPRLLLILTISGDLMDTEQRCSR